VSDWLTELPEGAFDKQGDGYDRASRQWADAGYLHQPVVLAPGNTRPCHGSLHLFAKTV